FYKKGIGMPLSKEFNRKIIKSDCKNNSTEIKELDRNVITTENRDSYATYLASLIYEYQIRLKYVCICLLTLFTTLHLNILYGQETFHSEIIPVQIGQ